MSNDIVLVLGASSDLGCDVIRGLKDCVVLAHYHSGLKKLEQLKNPNNITLIPIKADLSDKTSVQHLITTVKSHYAYPTKILHFAASKFMPTRFKDLNWEKMEQDFNIQVRSAAAVLKAFLPLMSAAKQGKVLFVLSSVTQGSPPKMLSSYVTIKYAMLGLMKSLAAEFADKNIQINAVSPSMIETAFLSDIPDKLIEFNAELHPLKRNATVDDVTPMIHFLLSEDAGFINGANIAMNGGAVI